MLRTWFFSILFHLQVHGMCGNFNGNREDDLSLTNGTTVTAPQFGNSWEVEEDSDKG